MSVVESFEGVYRMTTVDEGLFDIIGEPVRLPGGGELGMFDVLDEFGEGVIAYVDSPAEIKYERRDHGAIIDMGGGNFHRGVAQVAQQRIAHYRELLRMRQSRG
jgi:hypothetical protein